MTIYLANDGVYEYTIYQNKNFVIEKSISEFEREKIPEKEKMLSLKEKALNELNYIKHDAIQGLTIGAVVGGFVTTVGPTSIVAFGGTIAGTAIVGFTSALARVDTKSISFNRPRTTTDKVAIGTIATTAGLSVIKTVEIMGLTILTRVAVRATIVGAVVGATGKVINGIFKRRGLPHF